MSSVLRIVQVVCLVVLVNVVMPQLYDEAMEVNYSDQYYNEISVGEQNEDTPTATTASPCTAPDFSKWDKLFTMLENSQMKENMLLQYSDDIVKVGLQSLRAEVLEIVEQSSRSCAASVENSAHRAGAHAEQKLQQSLEHLYDVVALHQVQHDTTLGQILDASREQVTKLDKVEQSCIQERVKNFQTRDLEKEDRGQLQAIFAELIVLHKKLSFYTKATAEQNLPAGCDMALFFPMRSPKIHAKVIPERSMKTRAVTVCLWIKPTQILTRTVLFSYGTVTNPLELQLLLSEHSAHFTVRGEAHLVEARSAATEGSWVHLCGTWSSEQGLASLWVDGHKAASSPGVAEGHEIPADGVIILGQEYSGEGLAKKFGFQETFKAEEAFTGKLSGVNVWDRVLNESEIFEQAQKDGQSCGSRGNLVAWGGSQILEEGGVKLIY
ncbi:pentraxin-related protein PTX3 isoform X2 [Hemibagrus wyckioides]|uniref:pentraxin-related protein PTX3 isoform X2 n=1 Tax=Hemibagrus wyckioides TaxID=337641 RepID=UPI00266C387B|nr:pentraxin-related protein PTX3 isoform X2 [Hemibagrus wyckioides]